MMSLIQEKHGKCHRNETFLVWSLIEIFLVYKNKERKMEKIKTQMMSGERPDFYTSIFHRANWGGVPQTVPLKSPLLKAHNNYIITEKTTRREGAFWKR